MRWDFPAKCRDLVVEEASVWWNAKVYSYKIVHATRSRTKRW